MKSVVRLLLSGVLLASMCLPSEAMAHDDPVVTVRVMCDGFNMLDMDAVLGEISDSATLSVDRQVQGLDQIEAWVKEQMDGDLRIEIIDMGTPKQLSDGYTLTWIGRFSREDWRRAGIESRDVSNRVVIHNGRITEWTANIGGGPAGEGPTIAPAAIAVTDPSGLNGVPLLFGIPVSLIVAVLLAIGGAALIVRMMLRG